MIFFTTGSASSSGVPFRTGGRGVAASTSDELDVTGDFSGDVLTEEAAVGFTGDVTGGATGEVIGETLFGEVSATGKSANGERAGEILGSGEAAGFGEGVLLVLFDCSATTGFDTSGGPLDWETSAFEAKVWVIEWFGGIVFGSGETSEAFKGTVWEVGATLAGTSGSFRVSGSFCTFKPSLFGTLGPPRARSARLPY